MKNQILVTTVAGDEVKSKTWHKRFLEIFPRFTGQKELNDLLGEVDAVFAGYDGYVRINNIKRGIAGRELTEHAIDLMEQIRPATPATSKRLRRQGLVSPKS